MTVVFSVYCFMAGHFKIVEQIDVYHCT